MKPPPITLLRRNSVFFREEEELRFLRLARANGVGRQDMHRSKCSSLQCACSALRGVPADAVVFVRCSAARAMPPRWRRKIGAACAIVVQRRRLLVRCMHLDARHTLLGSDFRKDKKCAQYSGTKLEVSHFS